MKKITILILAIIGTIVLVGCGGGGGGSDSSSYYSNSSANRTLIYGDRFIYGTSNQTSYTFKLDKEGGFTSDGEYFYGKAIYNYKNNSTTTIAEVWVESNNGGRTSYRKQGDSWNKYKIFPDGYVGQNTTWDYTNTLTAKCASITPKTINGTTFDVYRIELTQKPCDDTPCDDNYCKGSSCDTCYDFYEYIPKLGYYYTDPNNNSKTLQNFIYGDQSDPDNIGPNYDSINVYCTLLSDLNNKKIYNSVKLKQYDSGILYVEDKETKTKIDDKYIYFTSSNPNIVTINEAAHGWIKGWKIGTATVTAKLKSTGATATIKVTVEK